MDYRRWYAVDPELEDNFRPKGLPSPNSIQIHPKIPLVKLNNNDKAANASMTFDG